MGGWKLRGSARLFRDFNDAIETHFANCQRAIARNEIVLPRDSKVWKILNLGPWPRFHPQFSNSIALVPLCAIPPRCFHPPIFFPSLSLSLSFSLFLSLDPLMNARLRKKLPVQFNFGVWCAKVMG